MLVRNIFGKIQNETKSHATPNNNQNLIKADTPSAKNLFHDFVR